MYYRLQKTQAFVSLAPCTESLDSEISSQFKQLFLDLYADAAGGLFLIDLGEVATADSAGLAFLLFASRCVRNGGGRLILVAVSAPVRKLLSISQIESSFEIYKSQAEALFALAGSRLVKPARVNRVTGEEGVPADAVPMEQQIQSELSGIAASRPSPVVGDGACPQEVNPAGLGSDLDLDPYPTFKPAFDQLRESRFPEPAPAFHLSVNTEHREFRVPVGKPAEPFMTKVRRWIGWGE